MCTHVCAGCRLLSRRVSLLLTCCSKTHSPLRLEQSSWSPSKSPSSECRVKQLCGTTFGYCAEVLGPSACPAVHATCHFQTLIPLCNDRNRGLAAAVRCSAPQEQQWLQHTGAISSTLVSSLTNNPAVFSVLYCLQVLPQGQPGLCWQ